MSIKQSIPKNILFLQKWCRNTTLNAITIGILKRPKDCQMCNDPKRRIEAHHIDYAQPFLVDWLCTNCHLYEHYSNKEKYADIDIDKIVKLQLKYRLLLMEKDVCNLLGWRNKDD